MGSNSTKLGKKEFLTFFFQNIEYSENIEKSVNILTKLYILGKFF